MILAFSACTNETEETIQPIQPMPTPPIEAPVEPGCPQCTSPEEEISGFSFQFRDTIIQLNQNMSCLLDILGQPLSIHETPSCAFDGYDRIFIYPGVQFHTFPVGDDDFIQIISLWDDGLPTREGVFIGSGWDAVIAAYGAAFTQEAGRVTFTNNNTTLNFFIENYTVVEISYSLIMN